MSADLVLAARAGDPEAWAALVLRHERALRAVARGFRLGPQDCEDVVQTTWLRAIEQLPRLRSPEALGAWLATTARREALRVVRSGARTVPVDPDRLPDPPGGGAGAGSPDPRETVTDALTDEARRRALWAAVDGLPERRRALMRLLACEPALSYQQIGAALGIPVGSIGPTRARCVEALRRDARLAA